MADIPFLSLTRQKKGTYRPSIWETFPVKDKLGNVVEGITQGLFGLIREYNSATQKTLTKKQ